MREAVGDTPTVVGQADPAGPGVVEAARLVRERLVSPVELLDFRLDRIRVLDPDLRAFDTLDVDGARRAARDAERAVLAGLPLGPLHGVPIACKRLFGTAGSGRREAAAPAALRAAGAVPVGTTVAPDPFGFDSPARNPWDPSRTPGWSSGGSAVAVAAGLVPAALGSDTVGSVRIPAALCGVVGMRPSRGRIDRRGLALMARTFDEVGPLAGRVEDVAALLGVLDPRAHPAAAHARATDARGLRIAVPAGPFHERCAPYVTAAVADAARILCAAGAVAHEAHVPDDCFDGDLTRILIAVDTATRVRGPAPPHGPIGAAVRLGQRVGAAERAALRGRLGDLRRAWARATAHVDVLVVPTVPVPAATADATHVRHGNGGYESVTAVYPRLCRPATLAGAPALTVPAGLSPEGLPFAVQFVGAAGGDAAVLRAGTAYQAAIGPLPHPPGLAGVRPWSP
ncbi:amidase [Embleya hyalina]|uniref:Amidase n=1 Tax=Embleya hyalina TaxID=516124 RepID=A0A401Z1R1_9ACTN|nr:amidase [Embleya hyalina]GCE00758.1 amidase [Embleya hyalina]